jgi:hypothetical protein
MVKNPEFRYLVLGNHSVFAYVNRRCLTMHEAENVKQGLEVIGYEVTIEGIKPKVVLK